MIGGIRERTFHVPEGERSIDPLDDIDVADVEAEALALLEELEASLAALAPDQGMEARR